MRGALAGTGLLVRGAVHSTPSLPVLGPYFTASRLPVPLVLVSYLSQFGKRGVLPVRLLMLSKSLHT